MDIHPWTTASGFQCQSDICRRLGPHIDGICRYFSQCSMHIPLSIGLMVMAPLRDMEQVRVAASVFSLQCNIPRSSPLFGGLSVVHVCSQSPSLPGEPHTATELTRLVGRKWENLRRNLGFTGKKPQELEWRGAGSGTRPND